MTADPPAADTAEWTALAADLRAYLASPAALPPPPPPPQADGGGGSAAGPTAAAAADADADAAAAARPPMPLAYTNLVAAGRYDLADRIGRAGGYVAVSRRLGLPIDVRPPPVGPTDADVAARASARAAFRGEAPGGGGGFLALGAARDARVEDPTAVAAAAARTSATGTGQGGAVAGRAPPRPRSAALTPLRRGAAAAARGGGGGGANPPSPPAVERVTFDAAARVGLVLLTALSAAAYGRSTGELLAAGALPAVAVDGARAAARAAVLTHALSAAAAAALAGARGRRRGAWAAKAAAGGVLVVAQLRRLPHWAPPPPPSPPQGGGE